MDAIANIVRQEKSKSKSTSDLSKLVKVSPPRASTWKGEHKEPIQKGKKTDPLPRRAKEQERVEKREDITIVKVVQKEPEQRDVGDQEMRMKEIYNYLNTQADKRDPPTDVEKQELWPRLSELSVTEACTVRDLMQYHRKLYPRLDEFLKSKDYPYDDMEDDGNDLRIYPDKLPLKLVAILKQYVDSLDNVDD